jgi:hypothetical protein
MNPITQLAVVSMPVREPGIFTPFQENQKGMHT